MSYQATVIPIMIASPGDVLEERGVIRSIIHDWNDVNAESSKVMLAGVGWETHSSPELGTRPQELINKRILGNCDLLIGVFWTRLGTPTGKSDSGTVEEIEEHVAAGKPAMIYFSSKPVAPESIDSDQYEQVKKIKKKWQPQGLIESYDNIDEFRHKLAKQLQLCLSNNEYLKSLLATQSVHIETSTSNDNMPVSKYKLSEDAKSILKAAAGDNGTILNVSHLGGKMIQAGGQQFGGSHGREAARWETALNELEDEDLIVGRGYKGEVFELTHRGWEVADAL